MYILGFIPMKEPLKLSQEIKEGDKLEAACVLHDSEKPGE